MKRNDPYKRPELKGHLGVLLDSRRRALINELEYLLNEKYIEKEVTVEYLILRLKGEAE